MTTTIAIQCTRCGVFGDATHWCPDRTLPDPLPMERLEPLEIVGRRRQVRTLGSAELDLEVLARHLPTLAGHALNPEPSIPSGRQIDGRSDAVDEKNAEVHDACRVLRRLAVVPTKHLRVLLFAFLVNGKESRDRWPSFVSRLGLVFATTAQRRAWMICDELKGAESGHGLEQYSAAMDAYSDIPEETPITDGQWLFPVLDTISRMVELADKELMALKSAKAKKRSDRSKRSLTAL